MTDDALPWPREERRSGCDRYRRRVSAACYRGITRIGRVIRRGIGLHKNQFAATPLYLMQLNASFPSPLTRKTGKKNSMFDIFAFNIMKLSPTPGYSVFH